MMLNSASVKGRILDAAAQAFATMGSIRPRLMTLPATLARPKEKFIIISAQKANWSAPFASILCS